MWKWLAVGLLLAACGGDDTGTGQTCGDDASCWQSVCTAAADEYPQANSACWAGDTQSWTTGPGLCGLCASAVDMERPCDDGQPVGVYLAALCADMPADCDLCSP